MKDFEIIRSADQIRSLANEQRLAILRELVEQSLTATMVAGRVGQPVNRVHYHVRQLVSQGLVQEVVPQERKRKAERFYRAKARQFLIDPGLTGPDQDVAQSVHQSLELSALRRRREEFLDLDLFRIARRVVQDCLGIGRDDKVLILCAPTALELAETLMVELHSIGAETRTKIWSRGIIFGTLDRHTNESLAELPFLHPGQDEDLDAMILVTSSLPQGAPPNEEQREKLPVLLDTVTNWQRSLRERGVRSVEMSLPHRGEFEGGWTTAEEAIDIYWACLDGDPEQLRRQGHALLQMIGSRSDWRLSDQRGSSFEFELPYRDLRICDGAIGSEDLAAGRSAEVLPAGQLFGVPTAGSAHGLLWADYTHLAGRHFYDVRLVLREGRIVEAKARDDSEVLLECIRRESGDPDLFAGIGIGLNPAGKVLTGKPTLDALLSGVVTVTFGDNEVDGGTVRSTLTLNLPSRSMNVEVGHRKIVTGGVLNVAQPGAS